MVARFRSRSVLAVLGVAVAGLALPQPAAAQPAPGEAECTATGYLAGSEAELAALRGELVEGSVHELVGVPLASGQTWVVPDGGQPVVVLDASAPVLSGGVVSVAVAGREFEIATERFAQAHDRYVTGVTMPQLGPAVRSLGLAVASGPCEVAVALSVDRSVWSTVAGAGAVGLLALSGLLTVLVARLRKGGWRRRFGFAAPFGLLAGVAQSVVLLEAGVVGPFSAPPWWPPLLGLALAALLPLTRWQPPARPVPFVPAGAEPSPPGPPPAQAPLAGYRVDEPVARTGTAGIYRATRGSDQALLKVVLAARFGEPAARLRVEREARALSGWEHPNLLRLRETVSNLADGPAGPPTLVFGYADGAPLSRLLAGGGTLSGPQAVNLVLEVLAGLQAVHERELVHRDLRPENVWLTTGGRVLLAGFELACAGVEHPAGPHGTAPYASPEQLARRVLDGRSDLWACGMLLGGLLTGRLPPKLGAGGVPQPLAGVLARALADEPADRPTSAEQFATELRAAAQAAFGVDWVGRGALAAAATSTAAVGAATASRAGGVPASVGVLVNVAAAVVAGAAMAAGAVLVGPEPARAQAPVVTPDRARVIFVRTMAEGWADDFGHFTEGAETSFGELLDADSSLADGELGAVEVGVAREQYRYPAWFVASALIPYDGGNASVSVRFAREAAGEPWLMATLGWSADRPLPAAVLDGDGWLARPPPAGELLVDPASLPRRYAGWLARAERDKQLGTDDVLSLRFDDRGMLYEATLPIPFSSFEEPDEASYRLETAVGEPPAELVPLVDGTVQVTFTSTIRQTYYNSPDQRARSCDDRDFWLFWTDHDPPGNFQWLAWDLVVTVEAWIPALAPVDPGTVVIEDWRIDTENKDGEPC
jgi:serine/threonine-protein kinase